MTETQIAEVRKAFWRWAERHSTPETPILFGLEEDEAYTPRQIAAAVASEDSSFGQLQLRAIASVCELITLEEFLQWMESSGEGPSSE